MKEDVIAKEVKKKRIEVAGVIILQYMLKMTVSLNSR